MTDFTVENRIDVAHKNVQRAMRLARQKGDTRTHRILQLVADGLGDAEQSAGIFGDEEQMKREAYDRDAVDAAARDRRRSRFRVVR